jgi:hypothetical protein
MAQSNDEIRLALQNFGLNGVWRTDCSKPASTQNQQISFDVTPAGLNVLHTGADASFRATTVVSGATATSPTELAMTVKGALGGGEPDNQIILRKQGDDLQICNRGKSVGPLVPHAANASDQMGGRTRRLARSPVRQDGVAP